MVIGTRPERKSGTSRRRCPVNENYLKTIHSKGKNAFPTDFSMDQVILDLFPGPNSLKFRQQRRYRLQYRRKKRFPTILRVAHSERQV